MAGQPLGAESEENQCTHAAYSAKVYLMVAMVAGNITTSVNKGRQARPMGDLLLLYVYGSHYLSFRRLPELFTLFVIHETFCKFCE